MGRACVDDTREKPLRDAIYRAITRLSHRRPIHQTTLSTVIGVAW